MKTRNVTLATTILTLLATSLSGQIPSGSFALMNNVAGTVGFWEFTPPLGFTQIGGVPSQLTSNGTSMEIDLLTGDFLVGTSSTSGGSDAEIWRCVLSGTTMVSATQVAVLSGTSGGVLEMSREREGCILALCEDAAGAPLVYRVIVTPAGTAVTSIPITAPAGVAFRDITSSPIGTIFMPSFAQGGGATSTLYTVPAAGGALTPTPTTYAMTITDVEFTLSSGIMAGGLASMIPGGNFSCIAVPSFLYSTTPPFSDIIDEITEDANLTTWVVANNGGQSVRFWSMNPCNPPGTLVSEIAGLGSVLKMVPASVNFKYGCGCPNSVGTISVINQGLPAPVAGGTWNLFLNNALPNRAAFLVGGTSSVAPIPVFGPGCFILNNLEVSFTTTTDQFGVANLSATLPANLAGTLIHAQWGYLDNAVPGGVALTGGLAAQL